MYRLIIIWDDGKREEYVFNDLQEAQIIREGYLMAFGSQVAWTGIY